MENGLRSTLIVRQSLATDFGTYTCLASNAKGRADIDIAVQEQSKLVTPRLLWP
jgi:hypothetical protein